MLKLQDYHWRTGNHIQLLKDGEEFFPRIKLAIANAQHFILLEMYLFESGHLASEIINLLCQSQAKGVQVFLLLDGIGSLGLTTGDRKQLKHNGVILAFYNPIARVKKLKNLHRDHRKLIVVDEDVAFVGGAGISDDFDSRFAKEATWHDAMLEIRGELTADCRHLFVKVWEQVTGQLLDITATTKLVPETYPARLMPSAGEGRQGIKKSVVNRIRSAEYTVWIATAYFFPSRKLRRDLQKAAGRGVDVRLLLPGEYTDHPGIRRVGHHMYVQLLKQGVRIFEYQPRFLHLKAVLCDDWVSIGSCNLDRWNQKWNLEANVEVDDLQFADATKNMFNTDFSESVEITYDYWKRRAWYRRWIEAISYRIARIIERIVGNS